MNCDYIIYFKTNMYFIHIFYFYSKKFKEVEQQVQHL